MPTEKHLRIGAYMPSTIQLLDLSPIDLFGMLDPVYLTACQLPTPLVALGIPSTIHYISVPSSGAYIETTAKASIRITKTTEDPEVQPGMLDIILVPGPDPSVVFDEEVLRFLRAHNEWQGPEGQRTDILSVCTGAFLLGQSGLLRKKSASGPRAIIPKLQKSFPDTKWVDDKRWAKDGNIWSSGKITVPLYSNSLTFIFESSPAQKEITADFRQVELRMDRKWLQLI
jgi:putative intracellular protease/amidase